MYMNLAAKQSRINERESQRDQRLAQLIEQNPHEYFVDRLERIVDDEIPLYSQDTPQKVSSEPKIETGKPKSFTEQLNELAQRLSQVKEMAVENIQLRAENEDLKIKLI